MRGFLGVSLLVVCLFLSASLGGCGGCGDDGRGGQLADAPPLVDAPPDMMVPPAVTLTVSNLGHPVAGVHVYFVNADDSLVKTVDTDASGNAIAVMAAGGSVTAINPFRALVVSPTPRGKGGDDLRSFLGVKPGDHLFLTNPAQPEQVTFQVIMGSADGANRYDLFSTCGGASIDPVGGGSGSPGGSVTLQGCQGAADLGIIAKFHNGESPDQLISGLHHADATLMADHAVSLIGDSFAGLTTIELDFPNSPDATIDVQHGPIGNHGVLGPFEVAMSGGGGTVTEPTVPVTGKAMVALQVTHNISSHQLVDWGDYTTTYTLDMQNLLLAELTDGPAFDAATDKVQWTEDDSGAIADVTMIRLDARRSEPQPGVWHWQLAAAHPATGELKLPVLPTDVFDWTPKAGEATVEPLTNFKVPGGYDAVRGHIFDVDAQGLGNVVSGASGRAFKVTSQAPPL